MMPRPLAAAFLLAGALLAAAAAQAQIAAEDLKAWPRTDFSKRSIDLAEIRHGGPPKDGIPAIDRPHFVTASAARAWLAPQEPVIVLRLGGRARAYPLQILMYHEIVNDTFAGSPVAVTFCPLCNASIVFDRRLDGRTLDFGTTGRLRKSDLVMYDRQTESWWQQFTGEGIVGVHTGRQLRMLPSEVASFAEFAAAYPVDEVLSQRTGHSRPYGRNPYRGYDRVGQNPFLFDDPVDKRLPAMERVLAITLGGRTRLHPFAQLEGRPVINESLAGTPYVVFARSRVRSALDAERIAEGRVIPAASAFRRDLGGRMLDFAPSEDGAVDAQTGSLWNAFGEAFAGPLQGRRLEAVPGGVHFAFAWLAFRPDSEIYDPAQAGR
ncbi:MAG: hypothetical protein CVU20_03190 [Betaproteobacteria bacterium HGW-Betaproteobacteria-14]|nr:MAG: hypothetical protein CVU20_03190 [Betaproteobacteria bacterium HGW-Betaproteobacteria-14]